MKSTIYKTGYRLSTAVIASLTFISSPSMADSFPDKPIELVIPFAQGGGTDQVGRAFAQFAEPHIGEKIFVSNRTGGSGAIGFTHGAQAAADGHVITMLVTTLAAAPHTIDGYPVTYKSFEPICLLSAPPAVLAVPADSEIKSLEDLIQKAKAEPGKLTFGTAGPGSNTHLTGASFQKQAGIKVRFVPHKGSGPALISAYGKHIDVAIADKAEVKPWLTDGRMRVLTVFTNDKRAGIDGVPLASEKGFDVDIGSFRGVGAPKGTPADVMSKLVEACKQTVQGKSFVEHMEKTGTELLPLFGSEFGSWLAAKDASFGEAVKEVDLKK